jgi:hypothetical protein
MALSASKMKQDIISALSSSADNANDANKKFGDAILANICSDIDVTYGWSAVNPDGSSDPTTSFKGSVSGGGTLTPSGSFPEMLIKLATLVKGLSISPPGEFSLEPLAFNPAGVLTVVMAKETTQNAAMEHFCQQVIASITGSFPDPSPKSGSHAAYNGATTGMVIA